MHSLLVKACVTLLCSSIKSVLECYKWWPKKANTFHHGNDKDLIKDNKNNFCIEIEMLVIL